MPILDYLQCWINYGRKKINSTDAVKSIQAYTKFYFICNFLILTAWSVPRKGVAILHNFHSFIFQSIKHETFFQVKLKSRRPPSDRLRRSWTASKPSCRRFEAPPSWTPTADLTSGPSITRPCTAARVSARAHCIRAESLPEILFNILTQTIKPTNFIAEIGDNWYRAPVS